MATKKQQQGICPKCGAEIENYGESGPVDDLYYHEYACKCGFEGTEWHTLQFLEHTEI